MKSIIDNHDLKNQIRNLKRLNEFVDRSNVIDAINNKDIVYIYYSGSETVNRGYRTVEPYVLGVSTAGNLVLRAYQQAGASDTGGAPQRPNDHIPGFRLFRLDGITSMNKTLRKFEGNRPNYNPQDKQMTQIIAAVQTQPVEPAQPTGGTKPDTYGGMTNDKSWFKNQLDKFKNTLFGKKQAPDQNDAAAKNWFGQQKRDFENKLKNGKQQNTDQNARI